MTIAVESRRQPVIRALKYGAIAGLLYFFIAFFANHQSPMQQRLLSSWVHGLLCMGMTFFSTTLMESIFNTVSGFARKYFLTIFLSASVVMTLMAAVHTWIGTENILGTLFASALTSLPYYLLFPLKLLMEYESSLDRFAYRRVSQWKTHPWKTKYLSKPYSLGDFFVVFWRNIIGPSQKNPEKIKYIEKKSILQSANPQSKKLKIAFLGDIMPNKNFTWGLCPKLQNFVSDADYLVANFEGSFFGDQKVFLAQKHHPQILEDLKQIMDPQRVILSLANNHSADFGYDVFRKTQEHLRSHGFQVIGARDQAKILLEEKVNIVAATQWSNQHHAYLSFLENSLPHQYPGKFNILYPHWGYEMELYPRREWAQMAQRLSQDWDCIIGHHSHVPGPVEWISSSRPHKTLVAYSLGDSSCSVGMKSYQSGLALKLGLDLEQLETSQKSPLTSVEWTFTQIEKIPSKGYRLCAREECELLSEFP